MPANRRKKYQRILNKKIRLLNKNISEDDLWLGRFEIRQKDADFLEFEDKSGGILYTAIRLYDKSTGYFKDYKIEFAPFFCDINWRLWEIANKFIVEDCGVWESDPRPSKDNGFVKDYRNKHIPEEVMRKGYNWFVKYKFQKEI